MPSKYAFYVLFNLTTITLDLLTESASVSSFVLSVLEVDANLFDVRTSTHESMKKGPLHTFQRMQIQEE